MNSQEVLTDSCSAFAKNFWPLVKITLPYLFFLMIVNLSKHSEVFSNKNYAQLSITLTAIASKIMIEMGAIKVLLSNRNVTITISSRIFFSYVILNILLMIGTNLGLALFIGPGLVFLSITFLSPIFVLKDQQDPLKAISSSVSFLRNDIWRIVLLLLGIGTVPFGLSYLITNKINFEDFRQIIPSFLVIIIWQVTILFTSSFMVSLFFSKRAEIEESGVSP